MLPGSLLLRWIRCRKLPIDAACVCVPNFLALGPRQVLTPLFHSSSLGWNKRIEYTPGAGSLALFPSIHLETCDEPLWNIQATVELQTNHVAKGCDRDNYSEKSLRKLCGELFLSWTERGCGTTACPSLEPSWRGSQWSPRASHSRDAGGCIPQISRGHQLVCCPAGQWAPCPSLQGAVPVLLAGKPEASVHYCSARNLRDFSEHRRKSHQIGEGL